jgi:redox-sensitive bicupin YhaK (pirin superfamily)
MVMSNVNAIYRAGYADYDGLDTFRAMPGRNVPIETLEPFIFLNHHGPQKFPAGNRGLPFGPHPHKGFETVTFIVDGELVHQDSTGFTSNIKAGGVQWMTAGRGIIHSETSSDAFKQQGGNIEILQLWINLPSRLKLVAPAYIGLQESDIPLIENNGEKATVKLISGSWGKTNAPIQSLSGVQLSTISFEKGGSIELNAREDHAILFYVVKGKLLVNGEFSEKHDLLEFDREGGKIRVFAEDDSLIIYGSAQPSKEPIVAQGPFVMNSHEEIRQAFVEYQEGKFGVWNH